MPETPDGTAPAGASAAPRQALVTGAGSGIGRAIALHLAREGLRVVGTVRSADRAAALTAEAARDDLPLRYLPLELSAAESREALAAALEAEGGPDVVVHNAGFGVFGSVEEVDGAAAGRQFEVTFFGPLALTRRLLPALRARRGHVIFIGSLAGRLSLPFQAHYSATKAAIASLSDALRMELRPLGVKVTCVEPGDFATGFTDAREPCVPDGSPYAEPLARCHAAVERTERGAPSPEAVARVVGRLLRRRNPPARRPVGRWARTICLMHRLLPDRLRERLVRSTYGV